jgi:hypothetical protein
MTTGVLMAREPRFRSAQAAISFQRFFERSLTTSASPSMSY